VLHQKTSLWEALIRRFTHKPKPDA
jgi:hypothetical protein